MLLRMREFDWIPVDTTWEKLTEYEAKMPDGGEIAGLVFKFDDGSTLLVGDVGPGGGTCSCCDGSCSKPIVAYARVYTP